MLLSIKNTDVQFTVALLGMLTLAMTVAAEVPIIMNYQGRLLDETGDPIDKVVDIKFLIYDTPQNGHVLWEDRHAVTVANSYSRFVSVAPSQQTSITPIRT